MGSDAVEKHRSNRLSAGVVVMLVVSLLGLAYFQSHSLTSFVSSEPEGPLHKADEARRRNLEGGECRVDRYLANTRVPGFHPACFSFDGERSVFRSRESQPNCAFLCSILIKAYMHGMQTELSKPQEIAIPLGILQKLKTLMAFVEHVDAALSINHDPSGW